MCWLGVRSTILACFVIREHMHICFRNACLPATDQVSGPFPSKWTQRTVHERNLTAKHICSKVNRHCDLVKPSLGLSIYRCQSWFVLKRLNDTLALTVRQGDLGCYSPNTKNILVNHACHKDHRGLWKLRGLPITTAPTPKRPIVFINPPPEQGKVKSIYSQELSVVCKCMGSI